MEKSEMTEGVSLSRAIDALIQAKQLANRRPVYIKSLRAYLAQFSKGREAMPIGSLDVFAIEDWFANRKESTSTRASNVGRLSSLFSFCERRGWVNRNPCKMLERPRIEYKPPRILTPEQAHKLISASKTDRPHMLPFFALGMFCGIRPDELSKLHWDSIDLEQRIVSVDASVSKVRQRRVVPIYPEVAELLRLGGRLPVSRTTRKRYIGFACAVLGLIDWPTDTLRKTCASYMLARERDAGRVSTALGNSPRILMTNYAELVNPSASTAFWSIRP